MVDVYDLDETGTGPLITRQGFLIRTSGEITLDLWSADWKLPAGHRIAVRVTDANSDWWIHAPTFDDVKVVGGSMTLPFLRSSAPRPSRASRARSSRATWPRRSPSRRRRCASR